jgi:hypothetical protein
MRLGREVGFEEERNSNSNLEKSGSPESRSGLLIDAG